MLVPYLHRGAVIDLFAAGAAGPKLMGVGFDELADHRYFQVAHQVRHEHEAIFQHGHRAAGLAAVIFRDLPGQLTNALLYLLRVQQDTLFNHSGFAQAIALR